MVTQWILNGKNSNLEGAAISLACSSASDKKIPVLSVACDVS